MKIASIRCRLGRHLRSRGRARKMAYGWHSYCRRCGVEMVKLDGDDWQIAPADLQTAVPAPAGRRLAGLIARLRPRRAGADGGTRTRTP